MCQNPRLIFTPYFGLWLLIALSKLGHDIEVDTIDVGWVNYCKCGTMATAMSEKRNEDGLYYLYDTLVNNQTNREFIWVGEPEGGSKDLQGWGEGYYLLEIVW